MIGRYRQHACAFYLSEAEIKRLDFIVQEFGFRSRYQLLQTIVRQFLRYSDTTAYNEEPEPLAKDIEDMFDEMMEDREPQKSYTTDRHHRR